jgi:hypothetical protein
MNAIPESLEPLALFALKQTGAEGYSLHEVDAQSGGRSLRLAAGILVPESPAEGFSVASFPLRIGDRAMLLAFVFRETRISSEARQALERLARAIGEVGRLPAIPAIYAREAARAGALEARLADSKIAERARGMLEHEDPAPQDLDTILHHVESVLRPSELEGTLTQFGRAFAQQIAERELTSRAKALLQTRYGLSEEEAHVHLRQVSRTTRKRLRDVAQAVIANPVLDAKGLRL